MHKAYEEKLPFYINGTLPDDERAEFEAHITGCEECGAAFAAYFDEWIDIAAATRVRAICEPANLPPLPPLTHHNHHSRHLIPFITRFLRKKDQGGNTMISAATRHSIVKPFPLTRLAAFTLIVLVGSLFLFALVAGDESPVTVEVLRSPEEVNRDVFQQYIEQAWNGGDVAVLENILAPELVCHDPFIAEHEAGITGMQDMVTAFRTGLPDLQLTVDSMIADDNTVWAQITLTGTHSGVLELAPGTAFTPSENPVELTQTVIARFENGRIAELWMEMDTLALTNQLGITASLEELALGQQNMAVERRFIEEIWGRQGEVTASQLNERRDSCAPIHEPYEHDPFPESTACTSQGGEAFINEIHRAMGDDTTITIEQMVATGDMVITHFTMQGTRDSYFGGIPPSNEEEHLDFVFIERYQDGKIVEAWVYWIAPFIYEAAYGE